MINNRRKRYLSRSSFPVIVFGIIVLFPPVPGRKWRWETPSPDSTAAQPKSNRIILLGCQECRRCLLHIGVVFFFVPGNTTFFCYKNMRSFHSLWSVWFHNRQNVKYYHENTNTRDRNDEFLTVPESRNH